MKRADMCARLRERRRPWDMAIIGGGATGVGVAVDAAARGYDVVLFEQADFGKGTSSRSTKLIHGGVRYLRQLDISLVTDALRERALLRRQAPHLVHELAFLVPAYAWWEKRYYGLGLHLYDLLAGRHSFGRSQNLSREQALARIATLRTEELRGGVLYHDGQFDDARLLISLARTAAERGATLLNYAPVHHLLHRGDGTVTGLVARDQETNAEWRVSARVVINAAGPFCDAVRRLSNPAAAPLIAPSQGSHLVLPPTFLPGATALLVPHTPDGRVLFAIPWHNHTLIGTTDRPLNSTPLEPTATAAEIDFILDTAGQYLQQRPTRADVLSVFAGIRPLVAAAGKRSGGTAVLSRDHHIEVDSQGVVTIAGGKWTTYRQMAEDTVTVAARVAHVPRRPCVTRDLAIHGYQEGPQSSGPLAVYGSEAPALLALQQAEPELARQLHPALPYTGAEVIWAARYEMARTVEDVLARRLRALFLNARAAHDMAPQVAELLASELQRDTAWAAAQVEQFRSVARAYRENI